MTTALNFDDFLDGPPQGPQLDALGAKFNTTRNASESDQAYYIRILAAAGYAVLANQGYDI